MSRPLRAEIDLEALRANLHRVRAVAPGSRVMAVIKANAYGHGFVPVARTLADADGLAVACLDEALELRDAGIDTAILVLEGCLDPAELIEAARRDLAVVVHCEDQLRMLEMTRLVRPVKIWLKINTGMNRLGIDPADARGFHARLAALGAGRATVLMTHLAAADERDVSMTAQQVRCFDDAISGLSGPQSIANSAAILGHPVTHRDWVRPGIMLYGASPFADTVGADEGLIPVMTLQSELIAVRYCRAGDTIGYGGDWRCSEDMPVGVIAIGYGDGYPRHARPGTPVLVRGQRAPLVGRVSMDMITVDLRGVPDAVVGDTAVLWGRDLPVEAIAAGAGTISYELFCRLTRRVPMSYRNA